MAMKTVVCVIVYEWGTGVVVHYVYFSLL